MMLGWSVMRAVKESQREESAESKGFILLSQGREGLGAEKCTSTNPERSGL